MSAVLANSCVIAVTPAVGAQSRQQIYSSLFAGEHSSPLIQPFLINRLPDSSYKLTAPVVISVEHAQQGFIASFDAANVHMSGDTPREAIENVLCLMIDLFDTFSANEEALGKEPRRQLDVLRSYIQVLDAH